MEKKIPIILVALFLNATLEANYCIQVLSTKLSEKSSVISKANSSKYNNFDDIRVEKRGSYLVFRIGDYPSYRDASGDVRQIRRIDSDAYIRKCDFIKDQAFYIRNEVTQSDFSNENYPEYERESSLPGSYVAPVIETPRSRTRAYENTKEYDTLWGQCQKYFVPVYEENPNVRTQRTREPERYVKPKKIERSVPVRKPVRVRTRKVTEPMIEESFWGGYNVDTKKQETRVKRKESLNKFDIEEQFLP